MRERSDRSRWSQGPSSSPDGRPIILGPDHATLGGYPVIAVVIGADLGRLGRLEVGDEISCAMVDLETARRALSEQREALESWARGAATTLADD